jgi:predicted HD superfamily hydrolase involved in NAD metabolism
MNNQQATVKVSGIPTTLTLEFAREWVRSRISEKRFRHTEGVAQTARELAARSNCDVFLAELGGLLHDCCKEVKDKELIVRAKEFGLKLHPIEELNGHLLHGPVAAETVRAELGLTNKEVLDAIAEHTLGAVEMTTLSKIVFLADAIEPGRSKDYVKPIWQALHPCVWPETTQDSAQPALYGLEALKLTGKIPPDLDKAVLVACDLGLQDLVESNRYIHPKTIDVRNFYLNSIKNREVRE